MTVLSHILKGDAYEQILTEIRYLVASARANERELVSIELSYDISDIPKILSAVVKTLKMMKKEGKIDFFVSVDDFKLGTAESSYLINKFPNITEMLEERKTNFIIKL